MCIEKTQRLECRSTILLINTTSRPKVPDRRHREIVVIIIVWLDVLVYRRWVLRAFGVSKRMAYGLSLSVSGRGGTMESESNP
jgi:hypothetical protein